MLYLSPQIKPKGGITVPYKLDVIVPDAEIFNAFTGRLLMIGIGIAVFAVVAAAGVFIFFWVKKNRNNKDD